MALSRSGSSNHDTTESLPYGYAAGTKQALDAFLQGRDPKQAKARSKDSSGGRRRKNFIDALPDLTILEGLLRRHKAVKKRTGQREYMRDYWASKQIKQAKD